MMAIASSRNKKPRKIPKQELPFDAQAFLDSAGVARKVVQYRKSQKIYSQGDPATSVLYIQEGSVKLSEGCLAGQEIRMGTATAVAPTAVLVIEKKEMMRVLHAEHALSDRFMSYILSRNIRIEEDLIDQLFNSSEKRLARILLLLCRYGTKAEPQKVRPEVSQEMLAEMIGTTRSRVNFFMNKFRKLGFIHYNGGLQVHSSLLSVVLHD